ncbi:MAG: translation initiation factor IF-3 [Candidatus Hepatoplasma vulgare]|nr:MAG: translation initiation factor IF-3 [Candidatus Hepatoplasma sp.]
MLLVIANDGEKLGVMSREDALKESEKRNLDLVLISKNSENPVAKIIDYGKFSYERKRKQEDIKKKTKIISQKEIRLTANIAENDLNFKISRAKEFLAKGYHVKISLMFKGREMSNKEKGYELMEKVISQLEDIAKVEKSPKLVGRFYNVFLIPTIKKQEK